MFQKKSPFQFERGIVLFTVALFVFLTTTTRARFIAIDFRVSHYWLTFFNRHGQLSPAPFAAPTHRGKSGGRQQSGPDYIEICLLSFV